MKPLTFDEIEEDQYVYRVLPLAAEAERAVVVKKTAKQIVVRYDASPINYPYSADHMPELYSNAAAALDSAAQKLFKNAREMTELAQEANDRAHRMQREAKKIRSGI